jgi:hypothetical protein
MSVNPNADEKATSIWHSVMSLYFDTGTIVEKTHLLGEVPIQDISASFAEYRADRGAAM